MSPNTHVSFAESYFRASEALKATYKAWNMNTPEVHIVLGTGFGSALNDSTLFSGWKEVGSIKFSDLPGLPMAQVLGHKGIFKGFKHIKSNRSLIIQVGRIHGYEGHAPQEVVLPVMASLFAGTKRFLLTNAAGSLTMDHPVGSVMLIRDHVNMTGMNPLHGPNPVNPKTNLPYGPRFPDLSKAYDFETRKALRSYFEAQGLKVGDGLYMGLLGPSFETPAEVQLFAKWGMNAVGMSTVWETIALNHAGAKVAGLSLISNAACGLEGDVVIDHEKLLVESEKAALKIVRGLFNYVENSPS